MPTWMDYRFAPQYAYAQDAEARAAREAETALQREREAAEYERRLRLDSIDQFVEPYINEVDETGKPTSVSQRYQNIKRGLVAGTYNPQINQAVAGSLKDLWAPETPAELKRFEHNGQQWVWDGIDPDTARPMAKVPGPPADPAAGRPDFGSGTKAQALEIVLDPSIPANDPARIAARRLLTEGTSGINQQTGEVEMKPGLELYGIDPYLTGPTTKPQAPTRTKLQKEYDEKATSLIPAIHAFNDLYKTFDTIGPSIIGADAGTLNTKMRALMGDIQKMEEFGVLNEGDAEHIAEIIGDPTQPSVMLNPQLFRSKMDAARTYIERRVSSKMAPFDRYEQLAKIPMPEYYVSPNSTSFEAGNKPKKSTLDELPADASDDELLELLNQRLQSGYK